MHIKMHIAHLRSDASQSLQKVRGIRARGEDEIELKVLHQNAYFLAGVVEASASSACFRDLEVDRLIRVWELRHHSDARACLVDEA
jgi:hypothetical protein